MTLADVARGHYEQQDALTTAAREAVRAEWDKLDPTALTQSWASLNLSQRLFVTLATYQVAAANAAQPYVAAALDEQGGGSSPHGALVPQAVAGVSSDGRPLESLISQPLINTLTAIGQGARSGAAIDAGGYALERIAATQVADAGRGAEQVAMAVEPLITGWVRMLVPPSCGRCAVLAGRVYKYHQGFERHPLCDCRHVPLREDSPDDLRTDPRRYFDSLSPEDQGRYFTVAGAEAIRLGADISQVVNARRGASGLSAPGRLTDEERKALRGGRSRARLERVDVNGRMLAITTEGTTRRGYAGALLGAADKDAPRTRRSRRAKRARLMPEAIAELADGDRDEQIRLLQLYGYIVTT